MTTHGQIQKRIPRLRARDHSRSVIYSWVLSYLLLTLVTVVLTGIVYIIARNTIENEINNSNRLLLENIRDNIDSTLAELDDLSMELLSSPEIRAASLLTQEDSQYYYKLYKAAQCLGNYKVFKTSYQHYYIYLGNIGRVVRPGAVNFAEDYFAQYIATDSYPYEAWLEDMSHRYYGDYIPIPFSPLPTSEKLELALVRTMPQVSPADAVTNIVIMTDFTPVLDYGLEDRGVLVLDGDNRIIAASPPDLPLNGLHLPELPEEHGAFTLRNENRDVVSYIASRQSDWKYITVTPEYVFWEKASFIRNVMVGEILLCVLGMGLLSFYFVRRNYSIVREITSFVRSKLQSDTVWQGNEFHYIRQAFSQSLEEKQRAQLRLDQQSRALHTNFLRSLLEGRHQPAPLDELLATYEISFPHPLYCVVCLHIERLNRDMWLAGEEDGPSAASPARFAVGNIAQEILHRSCQAYVVELEGALFCLINTPLDPPAFRRAMDRDLTSIKDFVAQYLDIDLCIGVGELCREPRQLHRSCREAQSAMDYARVLGRGETAYFADLGKTADDTPFYPFEAERRLINHIHMGERKAAVEEVRQIFGNPALTPELARLTALILSVDLLQETCNGEGELGARLETHRSGIARIMQCSATTDAERAMLQLTDAVMDSHERELDRSAESLSERVRRIVWEKYAQPTLCIASIAEEIGKSPYYISKLFKLESGGGILDFINSVRVERAKELLSEEKMTLEHIAQSVGFTNVRTFQRAFKKVEGVPPGSLRGRMPSADA